MPWLVAAIGLQWWHPEVSAIPLLPALVRRSLGAALLTFGLAFWGWSARPRRGRPRQERARSSLRYIGWAGGCGRIVMSPLTEWTEIRRGEVDDCSTPMAFTPRVCASTL